MSPAKPSDSSPAANAEMSAATTPARHGGAAWLHGWRVFVPVIVGTAAIQAALVIGDPLPSPDLSFVLLTALSAAVTVLAVALAAAGAHAAVTRTSFRAPGTALVVWSAVVVLGIAVVAVLLAAVTPLAILAGLVILPAAAAEQRNALRGFGVIARHPGRFVLTALAALALIIVSWLAAILLGFFVTGPLGAGLTWLWFGVIGTVLLSISTALSHRPGRS